MVLGLLYTFVLVPPGCPELEYKFTVTRDRNKQYHMYQYTHGYMGTTQEGDGLKVRQNCKQFQSYKQTSQHSCRQTTEPSCVETTEQSCRQSTEQSCRQTSEESCGQTSEQSCGQTSEQSCGLTTEQSCRQTTEQSCGQTSEQSCGQSTEQSYGQTSEQSCGQSTEQSYGQTSEESCGQTSDRQSSGQSYTDRNNMFSVATYNIWNLNNLPGEVYEDRLERLGKVSGYPMHNVTYS